MSHQSEIQQPLSPLSKAYSLSSEASTILSSAPSHSPPQNALKLLEQAAALFDQAAKDEERGVGDGVTVTTLQILAAQNRNQAKDLRRRLSRTHDQEDSAHSMGTTISSRNTVKKNDKDRFSTGAVPRRRHPIGTSSSSTDPSAPPFARVGPSASSSLHASSSSSSDRGSESYVVFGENMNSSDPFARFWNVLENAFDEISNPVAFTSFPLDIPKASTSTSAAAATSAALLTNGRTRKHLENSEADSIGDSFFLVQKEVATPKPRRGTIKTSEELDLENISLRLSLDAMSRHAQTVADELAVMKSREEKRGELMKSVVMGVRMEAQKAIQSQELRKSQMIGPPVMRPSTMATLPEDPKVLCHRILELEGQMLSLQGENDRIKIQLQKYKDRFERIRSSAKAKRDAKVLQTPSPLATLGEEDNEV